MNKKGEIFRFMFVERKLSASKPKLHPSFEVNNGKI